MTNGNYKADFKYHVGVLFAQAHKEVHSSFVIRHLNMDIQREK
jgi:hypothetical protein